MTLSGGWATTRISFNRRFSSTPIVMLTVSNAAYNVIIQAVDSSSLSLSAYSSANKTGSVNGYYTAYGE